MAKTTLEFNATQVAEIVADYVKRNFPQLSQVQPGKVTFDVSSGSSDRMNYSGPSLRAVKIELNIDSDKLK